MLQDILILALILSLFFLSIKIGVLDIFASVTALILGIVVYFFGGAQYILMLVAFVGISYAATLYHQRYKMDIFGHSTKRRLGSVISKGAIPFTIVLIPLPSFQKFYLFSVAVAAATADTVAGELGIFAENTYTIIGFRRTSPGEEGAISLSGEFFAFAGSAFLASLYYLFSDNIILSIWVAFFGFVGSNVDSLLGYTLERRGWVKKQTVNIAAIIISIFLAYTVI